jgi:nitroreductase
MSGMLALLAMVASTGSEPAMPSSKEKLLSQAIRDRRTTPSFAADPVPENDLRAILEAGLAAPSGYNTQPWRYVIVRDAAKRQALQAAAMGQPRVGEAPVVIVACGDAATLKDKDLEEMLQLAKEHGFGNEQQHEAVRRNFPSFLASLEIAVWLNRQVAISLTHMMLMAEVLGYDTAMMEGFHEDEVKEILAIPASAHVVMIMCVGKLKGKDKPYGGRFDLKRSVFGEKWGESL